MRQATKTTVLPLGGGPNGSSPILVRKGEAVSYSVYAMHRRKDLYGEDADQFRPDRWEPGSAKGGPDLRIIGWGYLPFNGGPRVCLGRECDVLSSCHSSRIFSMDGWVYFTDSVRRTEEFAFLEASYTIVRLLQTFKNIEMAEEETMNQRDHPDHTVTLVLASANGCKVRFSQ